MRNVVVIEDHPLFRNALGYLVRSVFDTELHLAESAEEGLEILEHLTGVALVVMDMGLPGRIKGQEAVAAVRRLHPDVPLLVVSGSEGVDVRDAALAAGADDYVSKTASTELLDATLRRMVANAEERNAPKRLTERQHEILRLLCSGLSNKEIGRKLDLSDATVKMHVTAILRSLGVVSRTQAVLAARSLGLDVASHLGGTGSYAGAQT